MIWPQSVSFQKILIEGHLNTYLTDFPTCQAILSTDSTNLSTQQDGEEGPRQTLCDKHDKNFVWKNLSPNFTFL